MPSDSYHESHIKKLLDPEYSSLYIETSLEETIKDRNITAFLRALRNVLEAADRRQTTVSEVYLLREHVYQTLLKKQNLTVEEAAFALKEVGIIPEAGLVEA